MHPLSARAVCCLRAGGGCSSLSAPLLGVSRWTAEAGGGSSREQFARRTLTQPEPVYS